MRARAGVVLHELLHNMGFTDLQLGPRLTYKSITKDCFN